MVSGKESCQDCSEQMSLLQSHDSRSTAALLGNVLVKLAEIAVPKIGGHLCKSLNIMYGSVL